MKIIYKYKLGQHPAVIEMPVGAKVLHVDAQHGHLMLWAEVDEDPHAPTEERTFLIIGTGFSFPEELKKEFIGTVLQGYLVWHIFEKKE
ncbi:MAG: hypothetical protein JKY62_17070 [Desulfocapsa sp.]|nr:hypothetical protein [Desulfocapsa sp.]